MFYEHAMFQTVCSQVPVAPREAGRDASLCSRNFGSLDVTICKVKYEHFRDFYSKCAVAQVAVPDLLDVQGRLDENLCSKDLQ